MLLVRCNNEPSILRGRPVRRSPFAMFDAFHISAGFAKPGMRAISAFQVDILRMKGVIAI